MRTTAAGSLAKRRRRVAAGARGPLERLRAICLALPETTEKIAWGEPTFRIGGKLFAQFDNHHHGADHVGVWLAMPLGVQEGLVYTEPDRFFVPPYVGRRGWVGVRLDPRPSWSAVADLVREAYRCVAPGRLARALPAARVGVTRGRKPGRSDVASPTSLCLTAARVRPPRGEGGKRRRQPTA